MRPNGRLSFVAETKSGAVNWVVKNCKKRSEGNLPKKNVAVQEIQFRFA